MAHAVRIQIYTMQTVEEALAVATLGVDHKTVGHDLSKRGRAFETDRGHE